MLRNSLQLGYRLVRELLDPYTADRMSEPPRGANGGGRWQPYRNRDGASWMDRDSRGTIDLGDAELLSSVAT